MKWIAVAIVVAALVLGAVLLVRPGEPEQRTVDGFMVNDLRAKGWTCEQTRLEPVEAIGTWICTEP